MGILFYFFVCFIVFSFVVIAIILYFILLIFYFISFVLIVRKLNLMEVVGNFSIFTYWLQIFVSK